ncbi:acyl carrier protein [Xylocopilactobacillus apicola]|uniref:Acyl carrier protein n=1 Tax=Xylocopilactobacillus apicola TaxID=2932184 RepID=A0AAU9DMI4_9LACO|nr:acyl carrier protein [Xylocopilactobacillus apicola]BDR58167.1 acyl carrier protein [Xylocopilactobacillus apicola]
MSDEEIFEKIKKVIVEQFEVEPAKVTPELNFKNDLDADSISLLEFSLELESEFGKEISDDDAAKILTVQDAVNFIKAQN